MDSSLGQLIPSPVLAALVRRNAGETAIEFVEACSALEGTLRTRRLSAMVLLLLSAAPPRAEAQRFVCHPIARGDTPSRLARQLTGHAEAAYTPAFQIRDPARQLFVPKSQYRRPLGTQWEACVAIGPVDAPLAAAPVVASVASVAAPPAPSMNSAPVATTATPVAAPAAPLALGPSDRARRGFVLMAMIGSAGVLVLLIGAAVAGSLTPRPIPADLRRAGEAFVSAFARPLIDTSSRVPPIQARLRFLHRLQRLEISIAPGAGRRYPNLADHKRNVEYDVNRVMRAIGPHVVVSDRLRTAGKWVVVPLHLVDPKQTGVK